MIVSLANLKLPPEEHRSRGPWMWRAEQSHPSGSCEGRAKKLPEALADVCFLASGSPNHVVGIVDSAGAQIFWQCRHADGRMWTFMTDEIVSLFEASLDNQEELLAFAAQVAESRFELARARGEL